MKTLLQAISKRAKESKKYRFQNLYTMLNRENLLDSWQYLNRKSSPGIDRETVKEYEKNLLENVTELVKRLKDKQYRPNLVKRVYIPKPNGKMRPLGLPSTEDKLVQLTATRILEAIFEEDFLANSFGYRPNRGAKDAVKELTTQLQFGKYNYIAEADIKGFFDNINHQWLIKMLEQRVDDKAFIRLIKKWLKAGILDTDGQTLHPEHGTPQGGIISPILANIYLHYTIDLWFEGIVKKNNRGSAYICRYADDFVCAFQYKDDAERFYNELPERLGKFGLELSVEKTRIISFNRFRKAEKTSFDFLGFEFRWGTSLEGKRLVQRKTSKKKFQQALKAFSKWCQQNRSMKISDFFKLVNAKLIGHYNYYGIIGNSKSVASFFYFAERALFKWLNRRSQKKSFTWDTFYEIIEYYKIEKPRIVEKWASKTEDNLQSTFCFT